MGNQQGCPAGCAPAPFEPSLHVGPGQRVQRTERFIQKLNRTVLRNGPQEGRALAHPTRQLGGIMAGKAFKTELCQQRRDPRARIFPLDSLYLKPQSQVVDDPPPRHQRIALRHEAKAVLVCHQWRPVVGDRAAVLLYRAGQQAKNG